MEVDTNKMLPLDKIKVDKLDKKSIYNFAQEAKEFLLSHKWCKRIINGYLGLNLEGILGVFYFEIEPIKDNIDSKLWVLTGDIPPAYLVTDKTPNPPCAIATYIEEMKLWVDAVKNNKPTEDIIPVNVPPTLKYADMLDKRLKFLKENVLPNYSEDLKGFYKT